MRQWHCFVGGQQYGPLGEDVLKSWVAEGRIRPTDLVWTEGMAQWAPLASIPELAGSAGFSPSAGSMTGAAPPEGTGGLTPNKELMRQARERLRGKWGQGVVFVLLFVLLNIGIGVGIGVFSLVFIGLPQFVGIIFRVVARFLVDGALELGIVIFFVAFGRGLVKDIGTLFQGFRRYGVTLGAYLLRFILVIGWFLIAALPGAAAGVAVGFAYSPEAGLNVGAILGGIPGVVSAAIAGLRYAMTFYLLADDPAVGPFDAITQSSAMMKGYKWKLFCLTLRFLGWVVLAILGCCIGLLWVIPYMQVSVARFYDDLRAPAAMAAQPAATTPPLDWPAPAPAQPL